MQRLEHAGLLGTFRPAPRVPVLPEPRVAAVVEPTVPQRRNLRPPQESRPLGAAFGRVVTSGPPSSSRGFGGVLGRLGAGDPLLLARLRRDPALLQQLSSTVDRLLRAL